MTSIDLNYLISELPPYMTEVLGKAGQDTASDLISKGVETLVRGAGRGAQSIAVSLRDRLRSSGESKKAFASFTGSDEHWVAAEAAMRLYELERTEENKARLAKLLTNDPEPGDSVFMSTFAQLAAMGEAELALPGLRSAASAFDDEGSLFGHSKAIEAAVAIGGLLRADRPRSIRTPYQGALALRASKLVRCPSPAGHPR